jgi:hypothetical protein
MKQVTIFTSWINKSLFLEDQKKVFLLPFVQKLLSTTINLVLTNAAFEDYE